MILKVEFLKVVWRLAAVLLGEPAVEIPGLEVGWIRGLPQMAQHLLPTFLMELPELLQRHDAGYVGGQFGDLRESVSEEGGRPTQLESAHCKLLFRAQHIMDEQGFNALYEEASAMVRRIKQKNDFITRGSVGSEARLIEEINSDKEFLSRDVQKLNSIIHRMEQNYVDPFTVRKLDALKKEAKKQISRNEYLIKDLIKNTFETLEQQHNSHAGSAPKKNSFEMEIELQKKAQATPSSEQKQLMVVHQGTPLELELQAEKTRLLAEFERTIVEVHDIMKETEGMVYDQGENLNLISDEIQKTQQNVASANENMEEASQHQKKHLKYCIVVFIVVLVTAGIVMGVFIAKK